jgi:hypothetical protein
MTNTDGQVVPILGRVTREGDDVVIRMPVSRAHSLRVALEPCPCPGVTRASEAVAIRVALAMAIGRATR